MKTRIYKSDDLGNKAVQEDIRNTFLKGGNVVFPTETVYGIGAYALLEEGIQNIYKVKGRPSDNPLIMHVSRKEDIGPYIKEYHPYVEEIMDAFWPGPLTLVFNKSPQVPKSITGGLDTVGIRVPSNVIARQIIDIAGLPICAPSANISGRPSSTLFSHVMEDFNGKVDIIIDGGKSEIGLESTVLDVSKDIPIILRPGMVTKEMLETVVKEVMISSEIAPDDIPKAPGMKYKHYAPKGHLKIVEGKTLDVVSYINEMTIIEQNNNKKVGVITTLELASEFQANVISVIGKDNNTQEIASNLFQVLREMDAENVDVIYSLSFHESQYGRAIMNRLLKAANHTVVSL
jgi:L-threonylcarbamoyladenylate synthase